MKFASNKQNLIKQINLTCSKNKISAQKLITIEGNIILIVQNFNKKYEVLCYYYFLIQIKLKY